MSARQYVPISNEARDVRNRLLTGSDWTLIPGSPLTATQKAAWKIYRQALRDVPKQTGFPGSVIWPVVPV